MTDQTAFVAAEVDRQIEAFRKRRAEYKRKSTRAKVAVVVLAALSTVLVGLQGIGEWGRVWIQNLALLSTALVTLVTSLEMFFNHQALYVRYTGTTVQLYMLRAQLQYLLSKSHGVGRPEDLDQIYARLTEILEQTSSEWLAARKESKL